MDDQDGTRPPEDLPHQDEEDVDADAELLPPFLPDQRVFCRDQQGQTDDSKSNNDEVASKEGPKLYEAIVRRVRRHYNTTTPSTSTIPWSFLIHYQGWNARWDRWVDASQLVPDTSEHRQRYEQQQEFMRKKDAATAAIQQQKQQQLQMRKQKRKEQQGGANKTQRNNIYEEKRYCELPFTLKTLLVEEWEHVKRKGFESKYGWDSTRDVFEGPARSVHCLPAAVTVRQLLKQFEKKRRKQYQKQFDKQRKEQQTIKQDDNINGYDGDAIPLTQEQLEGELQAKKQNLKQFCEGLLELFEEALPKFLLYPEERPQLEHLRATQATSEGESKKSLSEIYGCEYFLRLLVRLPILLHQADLQRSKHPPRHELVGPLLTDLIVVLQQNRSACFKGKYRPPIYPSEWLSHEIQRYNDCHPKAEAGKGQAARDSDTICFRSAH